MKSARHPGRDTLGRGRLGPSSSAAGEAGRDVPADGLDVLGLSFVFANDLTREELSRLSAGVGFVVMDLAGPREAGLASALTSARGAGRLSVVFASGAAEVAGVAFSGGSCGFMADAIAGVGMVTDGRRFVRR